MTKLERLLIIMDRQNHIGTIDSFNRAEQKVGEWVFTLWKRGLLDPSEIKAEKVLGRRSR